MIFLSSRITKHALSYQCFFFTIASYRLIHGLRSCCQKLQRSVPSRRVRPRTVSFGTRCLANGFPTKEEIRMTADAKDILFKAIEAVNPVVAIERHLKVDKESSDPAILVVQEQNFEMEHYYDLSQYEKVIVVAFGKASSAMASAVLGRLLEARYPVKQISGLVIVKDNHATPDECKFLQAHHIKVREASHPIPDHRSVAASNEILTCVQDKTERKLVISCISGGGSALFCAPNERLSLEDLQSTNKLLLSSGMKIQEMNVIRKRLELGKGGRLAASAYPGHVLSLILSDVIGDPLDLIASGPTVPDTSSWKDAWDLVRALPQEVLLPDAVLSLLHDGVSGKLNDSPSQDHPVFRHCQNILVGNNAIAVQAAAERAKSLGYHPLILGTQLEGEANQAARFLVTMSQHARNGVPSFSFAMNYPLALLFGGETTVSLPSSGIHGKGGRNQELALQAAILLKSKGLRQVVVASLGTDGTDGPTDAAGAIVDGTTVDRLPGDALKALSRHDAYPYFEKSDEHSETPLLKVWYAVNFFLFVWQKLMPSISLDWSNRNQCRRHLHGFGSFQSLTHTRVPSFDRILHHYHISLLHDIARTSHQFYFHNVVAFSSLTAIILE